MPRCCQCKGGGLCKRCSCVRDNNFCKDCYHSLLGHCLNLPSDDPDFSELVVNPVVHSDVSSDSSNDSSVPNEAFDPVNNRSHHGADICFDTVSPSVVLPFSIVQIKV